MQLEVHKFRLRRDGDHGTQSRSESACHPDASIAAPARGPGMLGISDPNITPGDGNRSPLGPDPDSGDLPVFIFVKLVGVDGGGSDVLNSSSPGCHSC